MFIDVERPRQSFIYSVLFFLKAGKMIREDEFKFLVHVFAWQTQYTDMNKPGSRITVISVIKF